MPADKMPLAGSCRNCLAATWNSSKKTIRRMRQADSMK
ncbi:MAG: DUF1244 domain-containing protein [Verrucomicrobiales bacterium]|nr:DUF1244 domain-containing protein [Verrucomicrobiales bacterium]